MPLRILVTGGAGYVGSALVPALLQDGHEVTVLDLYLYGDDVLKGVRGDQKLTEVKGDIRDQELLRHRAPGHDVMIHLACISNDPSFEMDPALGKSINYDAFRPLVQIAKKSGIRRFINASSSSVYGVKDVPDVTEDMTLEPLTDYSKYKALCEDILAEFQAPDFTTVTVRPATVCGYAPRQRLDVVVNILTNHAVHSGIIKVLGGKQMRPNIHIDDMVDVYRMLLELPDDRIAGKVYNAGGENHTVMELATMVRNEVDPTGIRLEVVPTDDNRSYHISSAKIASELGWRPKRTIRSAVQELATALRDGRVPEAMTNSRYYNIRRMQELSLV